MDETQKIKVVFLGDRSVGKTSIIKRFIRNEFTEKQNVLRIGSSPLSASTTCSRRLTSGAGPTSWSCGTRPANRNTVAWSRATWRTLTAPCSSTTWTVLYDWPRNAKLLPSGGLDFDFQRLSASRCNVLYHWQQNRHQGFRAKRGRPQLHHKPPAQTVRKVRTLWGLRQRWHWRRTAF